MKIYDIIHGTIQIDGITQKIINTEEFQRLRSIKQLGCCNYVFPSATHTRFEHSIGVYHLASKYIEILKNETLFTECQIKCILCAALIHDLGHGPYSHLFDELFDESKNHEYRSIQIFKKMNEKYNLHFTDDEIDIIYRMIDPKKDKIPKDERYIYQIVSNKNGIDVDRFDYLMRDIHMTGLNYGIEYQRIMNYSEVIDGKIKYSDKVKTNIEDFFHIRFIMYREVYNHKKVRSLEHMMKEYLKLTEEQINIKQIVDSDDIDKFIDLNDSIINLKGVSDLTKRIVLRMKTRRIYKIVGEIELKDYEISMINYPFVESEKVIVDKINIRYYGVEACEYFSNSKYRKITNVNEGNNNIHIIYVYSKEEEYDDYAKEYFDNLIPIRI